MRLRALLLPPPLCPPLPSTLRDNRLHAYVQQPATTTENPSCFHLIPTSSGSPLEAHQAPGTFQLLLEPTDVVLRMRLVKSRVIDRRGETVSPGSSGSSSTISVILTPSLWLSQGGGVLISVELSRANFTLHSSAIATAARLAARAHP